MTNISNRPTSEHPTTVEEIMIAKLGGKREYGRFRDALLRTTRKPRRSRRARS